MNSRLLTLAIGMFAIGTDSFVVAGMLPEVAGSLGVGVGTAGQLITAYALSYALMTPVMATLTSHLPRRMVLVAGLSVFVLGNAMTALATGFWLALAGRIVAGMGGAIYAPSASATAAALVPPDARGRALAIVMAGLSGATALGAPLGTWIGSMADWRTTIWLVAMVGVLAGAGVMAALPELPGTMKLTLRDRLAVLGDRRVVLTLSTTLLVLAGLYTVYSYVSVVFARATGGRGEILAILIAVWGVAATIGNLTAGALTDRFGSRLALNLAILLVGLDFVLLPVASADLATTVPVLIVWGVCGWGMVVPQQHRLIGIAPSFAPILLALNGSAVYAAVAASGVIGAFLLPVMPAHHLGYVGAALVFVGLLVAESAHRLIRRVEGASISEGQQQRQTA